MKLRALDLSAKELLSREQMKKVLGGVTGSGSGGSGDCSADACPAGHGQGASCTNPYTGYPGTCSYRLCSGAGYYYYQCS